MAKTPDDVAVRVACDVIGEPLGVWFAADHDEQRDRWDLLDRVVRVIGEPERFEVAVARAVDHLGMGADDDSGAST